MTRVSSGLMPAVGSSSSSSRGRLASAIPISSARCSPCASVLAVRSRDLPQPDQRQQFIGLLDQFAHAGRGGRHMS